MPVFNRFDGSQPTVAKYLQAAGYYTGMIGKWHLAATRPASTTGSFCRARASISIRRFSSPTGREGSSGLRHDIITDLAIDFLKNRPKDKPFFLMCHHKAPHRPWEPDEKHKAMFADRVIPEPATLARRLRDPDRRAPREPAAVFDDLTRRDLK